MLTEPFQQKRARTAFARILFQGVNNYLETFLTIDSGLISYYNLSNRLRKRLPVILTLE